MTYRPDLDGLRALAILLVVGYHIGFEGFSGGFVGVDVFFVLSGFLITSLLIGELRKTDNIDFAAFYARRVRRLLPALAVVLVAVALVGWFVLTPVSEQQDLARSLLATALFVVNFYFRITTDGYFAASADREPLLNMWTLAVEEQFYLVWPLLLLIAWRVGKSLGRPLASVATVFCVTFVLSLAASALFTQSHPVAAFYLLPMRTWEFASGAMLAALPIAGARVGRPTATLLALAGCAMIVAASVAFSEQTRIPGTNDLLPVLGTCALIAAGALRPDNPLSRLLSTRPAVFIGSKLSYSTYLWHWPCLVFVRLDALGERNVWRDSLVAAGSVGLAWLTYVLIEKPARTRRWRLFATDRGSLLAGVAISACVLVLAGTLWMNADRDLQHSPRYVHLLRAMQDSPSRTQPCHQPFPFEGRLTDKALCSTGAMDAPLLVLWGDSHANQLAPTLERFSQVHGIRFIQRSMSSCPPLLNVTPRSAVGTIGGCSDFNAAVLQEIRGETREREVGIVLAAYWPDYLGESSLDPSDRRVAFVDGQVANTPDAQRVLDAHLRSTLLALQRPHVRIVIVEPIPQMRYDVPICLARHSVAECSVSRLLVDEAAVPAQKALQEAARGMDEVRLWDPSGFFCDPQRCYPQLGSIILYRDNNHLTASAAEALEPAARAVLLWASFR